MRGSRICSEKSDFYIKSLRIAIRNTHRGKSLKAFPFVMTYHSKHKSRNKVILKYLDILYIGKEAKPMILFQIARKLSSYLVRTKLYSTKRTLGSYKCGGKGCEVCININETPTYTSPVARETCIINHRFDSNERCLVYFLNCNKCKMQYVGQIKIDQLQK